MEYIEGSDLLELMGPWLAFDPSNGHDCGFPDKAESSMMNACNRIAKKYPNAVLGIGGICVAVSPLPLLLNLKSLDENVVSVGLMVRYEQLFCFFLRIAAILACVVPLVGIVMIAVSVVRSVRNR